MKILRDQKILDHLSTNFNIRPQFSQKCQDFYDVIEKYVKYIECEISDVKCTVLAVPNSMELDGLLFSYLDNDINEGLLALGIQDASQAYFSYAYFCGPWATEREFALFICSITKNPQEIMDNAQIYISKIYKLQAFT